MIIERMRWWDLPAVHDIEESLFPDDSWSAEQFWQELAQPTRYYVVARDRDELVGYAGAFLLPPDADIQTVGVRSDQQGKGIARALLDDVLAHVDRAGATHTMLEVRAGNDAALHLYERLGFTTISRRPRYYPDGEDAVIMRRPREVADHG